MRSTRQRLVAATLLSGLTTLGLGLSAGTASAAVDACTGYLGDAQSGSLHITSNPAAGSEVLSGSAITVQASWDADDFDETDRFYVCATVNGDFVEAMSSEDRGVANNGSYSAASNVPSGIPAGSDVCLVSAVLGRFAETGLRDSMVSETACFRTAAAVEPTTTTTTAPVVEPVVVEAGTPAAPAVEAAPAPAEEPAPLPVLPRTGSGLNVLAGLGSITLSLGGLARFLGRRRPAEG
jgi:hypothetical protein